MSDPDPWQTLGGIQAYAENIAEGDGEQAWSIESLGDDWAVSWVERGNRVGEQFVADSREGAGYALVGRLVYSRLLAGGGYWATPDAPDSPNSPNSPGSPGSPDSPNSPDEPTGDDG